MRVLILSVTAGQGHNTTATAISTYLASKNVDVQVLDTFAYLNKLLGNTIDKGYLASVDYAQKLYSTVYKQLEKRKKNANDLSATRVANMVFIKKMKTYIDDYDPDVIVVTHVFAGVIVDIMKQRYGIRAKTFGILTDFTMHPYWEECLHFDYLVIANENLIPQAKNKGYTSEQILPFGIPINPKFSNGLSKEDARAQLSLENKKTLLLMSGSMGYGKPDEIVKCLDKIDEDFQIICVCGNNSDAKNAIDGLTTQKKVLNYGFTKNVDVLMDAADLIVSKPGGLTTSESLAKHLPMILVNPIPGHEERNVQFLLNSGVAMEVTEVAKLNDLVEELFTNEEKLELMHRASALIGKPNATSDLCEFILKMEQ